MNAIIFSHGKESGPNGTKITLLSEIAKKLNFQTISIDYTNCADVNERVVLLRQTMDKYSTVPKVLVGSSMGGYVSTVLACERELEGLFLMCPALYLPNYDIQAFKPKNRNIEIIHGWNDSIVPYENSIKFAKAMSAKLHLINDNHRLTASHDFLGQIFKEFLDRIPIQKNQKKE